MKRFLVILLMSSLLLCNNKDFVEVKEVGTYQLAVSIYESKKGSQSKLIKNSRGQYVEYALEDLARMGIAEQINGPVLDYLTEVGKNIETPQEMYFAVFMPAFIKMYQEDTEMNLNEAIVKAGKKVSTVRGQNKAFETATTLQDVLDTAFGN